MQIDYYIKLDGYNDVTVITNSWFNDKNVGLVGIYGYFTT